MKFNSTTVTISVGQHARRIFEDLDKMRPNHLSMSLFLAVVAEDYVHNHGLNTKMIDFIDNSNKNSLPIFYAPIKNWTIKSEGIITRRLYETTRTTCTAR